MPEHFQSIVPMIQVGLQFVQLIAVVVGLWFTTRQLRLLQLTYRDYHDWNRRKAAQDVVETFKDFAADSKLLNEHFPMAVDGTDPIPLQTVLDACQKVSDLKSAIHRKLNYFESLAVGIEKAVYDEELVKSAFRDAMWQNPRKYGDYIPHRRGKGFKKVWSGFEALCSNWNTADKESTSTRTQTG